MARKMFTVHYTVGGLPQVGLTPTIDIFELDPIIPTLSNQVVNNGIVAEVGVGWYRYDYVSYDPSKNYVFTVDGGAQLTNCDRFQFGGNESYVEDIAPAVWNEPAINHMSTGTTGEALTFIRTTEATIYTLINTLLKYERNRTKIDVANAQLIIYDDDCITPLTTFNLKDFNGMPSVQEVCERVPTTC